MSINTGKITVYVFVEKKSNDIFKGQKLYTGIVI